MYRQIQETLDSLHREAVEEETRKEAKRKEELDKAAQSGNPWRRLVLAVIAYLFRLIKWLL